MNPFLVVMGICCIALGISQKPVDTPAKSVPNPPDDKAGVPAASVNNNNNEDSPS